MKDFNEFIESQSPLKRLMDNLSENDGIMLESMFYEFAKEQVSKSTSTKRYLFWFESEGKNGLTFEIEAKDSNEAYDKAYDAYGPQVAGMMYKVIKK